MVHLVDADRSVVAVGVRQVGLPKEGEDCFLTIEVNSSLCLTVG